MFSFKPIIITASPQPSPLKPLPTCHFKGKPPRGKRSQPSHKFLEKCRCPSHVSNLLQTSPSFHPNGYKFTGSTNNHQHLELDSEILKSLAQETIVVERMHSLMEDGKYTVVFRGVSKDEEGRKKVEKTEVSTNNIDRLKHIEKKLIDKGDRKLERHPVDGLPLNRQPKSGHGGKFTWEGPRDLADNEFFDVPSSAIDKGDPNYVDEEEEEMIVQDDEDVAGLVVGEVEVAKEANKGVARIQVKSPTS